MKKESNAFWRFIETVWNFFLRFIETVWNFFASVKLALFTLFILAAASIIGTVIPQKESLDVYVRMLGPKMTKFFQMLDIIPDVYRSGWFLTLLGLFSLNLIICTIERLPNVWRMVVQDNLATEPARLEKMGNRKTFKTSESIQSATNMVQDVLANAGWNTKQTTKDGGILLFSQKGPWTRLGVYIVHMSILIIFVGAIIGARLGHKGTIMIPEGMMTNQFYSFDDNNSTEHLDFSVKCDFFTIDFYRNGQPKEYRSDLIVFEKGKEVLRKTIEVNDPLDYKGYTFYQANYRELDNEFLVTVQNKTTGSLKKFNIPAGQLITWNEDGIEFGIVSRAPSQKPMKYRFNIWMKDNKANPSQFWVDEETPKDVQRPETIYSFTVKRRYATGLQVAKDPGVWTVYAGCTIMLIGLYVAFFLSHRRIWVFVNRPDRKTRILLSGIANKNRYGFEKHFEALSERLGQTRTLEIDS